MESNPKVRRSSKSNKSYTIADMYHNMPVKPVYAQYKRVYQAMAAIILEHVLERSECVKLPCGLGFLTIVKHLPKSYSPENLNVDYHATKLYGKRIYHLNEHSNGFKYRLHWSRIPMTFANRYKYSANLVRRNKRRLAQLIFNKHDYINANDIQLYYM